MFLYKTNFITLLFITPLLLSMKSNISITNILFILKKTLRVSCHEIWELTAITPMDDSLRHGTLNTLRPIQNGRNFADDIFKCIFLNENVWIPIKISMKFVPKGQINNISALVQIMAWRRPGDKPLSEPMIVSLTTHICVIRPQRVNTVRSRQNARHFVNDFLNYIFVNDNRFILIGITLAVVPMGPMNDTQALIQIMAWRRLGDKPLSEPMMA